MPSNPLNMKLFELDKNESCWLSIPAVVEFFIPTPENTFDIVTFRYILISQAKQN